MKKERNQTGKISALAVCLIAAAVSLVALAPELVSQRPVACSKSAVVISPQLDDVYLIEAIGTIETASVVDIGGEAPGLVIVSGTDVFALTFATNPGLQTGAYNNVGKCVKIAGTLKNTAGIERPDRKWIDVETLYPSN